MKAFIFYTSPAGSTASIAQLVADTLEALPLCKDGVRLVDLGAMKFLMEREKIALYLDEITQAGGEVLVCAGSPVYVGHALWPVQNLIEYLPASGGWFLPFTTYGAISSGVALSDMGQAAARRTWKVAGAFSAPAVHSQMWRDRDPLGQGRPSSGETELIKAFLKDLGQSIAEGRALEDLQSLDHPDPRVRKDFSAMHLGKAVEKGFMADRVIITEGEKACTLCGTCARVCPLGAVEYGEVPLFTDRCVYCFDCVRLCPTDSMLVDMEPQHEKLRKKLEYRNEDPQLRFVRPEANSPK